MLPERSSRPRRALVAHCPRDDSALAPPCHQDHVPSPVEQDHECRQDLVMTCRGGGLFMCGEAGSVNAVFARMHARRSGLTGTASIGTGGLNLRTRAKPGSGDIKAVTSSTYTRPATGDLGGAGTIMGSSKPIAVGGSFAPCGSRGHRHAPWRGPIGRVQAVDGPCHRCPRAGHLPAGRLAHA